MSTAFRFMLSKS